MSKILKNVFLTVGMFVFVFAMFGLMSTNKAEAATITSTTSGIWNATSTWVGGVVPIADSDVVIAAGHTVTLASGQTITAITSLTIDATGVLTNAASISIPTVAVAGTLTNSGTLTVATAISGAGLITNTGTLNIGGTSSIAGTLTTNASGATVNYTGSGQTCKVVAYANLNFTGTGAMVCAVTSAINITTSGTATWATSSNVTLTGTLTVGSGTSITNAAGNTLVAPTTVVTGTLTNPGTLTIATALSGAGTLVNSATTGVLNINFGTTAPTITTLTATGTGNIVNYTAAAPNCKVAAYDILNFTGSGAVTCAVTTVKDITLSGTVSLTTTSNITLTGTLTVGAGTLINNAAAYTLIAPTTVITGTGPSINAGTMTIGTSFTGAGALTNTGTLNLGGATTSAAGITTLTATATGNLVNYNLAGAQTVKATTYYDLNLAGSGLKTIANTAAVSNYLSMITGVSALIANGEAATAYAFRFDGSWKATGTWAYSGATNNNTTYFNSSSTGTLTVSHKPSVSAAIPIVYTTTTTTTTTTTPEITTVVVTTTEETAGGCSGGNLFNTSTGAACVNNPAVPQGCGGGKLFSPVTGQVCPANSATIVTTTGTTTTTTTYNFGTTTLKNGSRGNAVMELQRFLNAKLMLGLVVDGKLGPKTIAVIKKWQKDNNLVADGLVGAKTKAKMNAEAN